MKKTLTIFVAIIILLTTLPLSLYAEPSDLVYTTIVQDYTTHNGIHLQNGEGWVIYGERLENFLENYTYSIFNQYGLYPIEPPTAKYNSHTYAWLGQDTTMNVWLRYLTTVKTDAISVQESDLQAGDIVVYKNAQGDEIHSAVIESITSFTDGNVIMVSKWEEAGVYRHSIENTFCYPITTSFSFYRIVCDYTYGGYVSIGNFAHRMTCRCGAVKTEPHTPVQFGNTLECSKCGHVLELWNVGDEIE